jgi:hypothetical protein
MKKHLGYDEAHVVLGKKTLVPEETILHRVLVSSKAIYRVHIWIVPLLLTDL